MPQKAIAVPTQNAVVWSQQKVSRPQSAPSRREEQSELAKIPSTSKRRPTTSDRFRGAKCPVERMERPGLQRSGTRNSLLSEETYHGTIDLTGPGSSTAASRGSVEFQPEGEQFAIEHPQQSRHQRPRSRPSSAPNLRQSPTPTQQLGVTEVKEWMTSGRSPWHPRKDARSVVNYKSSAHSGATKRYVVRTDNPMEVRRQAPQVSRESMHNANFAQWLWEVVTKPATAIVDDGAGAKPVSQLERAKNGRRISNAGAMRQVELPQRHEVQQWQEEVKARSERPHSGPSSAVSRTSAPVIRDAIGTAIGDAPARQPVLHRGFATSFSLEGKQLAIESGELSRSLSIASMRLSRPQSASAAQR